MTTWLNEALLQTATKYGASNVHIFSSVARGDADEQSDLDLLVDMKDGHSLFDIGGWLTELEELLGSNVNTAGRVLGHYCQPQLDDRDDPQITALK